MKYEKTQKGNPHNLTINQHVFPAASISRFIDSKGCVSVYYFHTKSKIVLKPDNQVFCAKRVWDQRAESGYMKNIEDDFQLLASSIANNRLNRIGFHEKNVIDKFYSLWCIRSIHKKNPVNDANISGISGPVKDLTHDEQEILEKNHYGYLLPNNHIPGRQVTGFNIQMNLLQVKDDLKDIEWCVLRSINNNFLVPDMSLNIPIIPISPRICLYSGNRDRIVNDIEVSRINLNSISGCNEYFLARDISKVIRL